MNLNFHWSALHNEYFSTCMLIVNYGMFKLFIYYRKVMGSDQSSHAKDKDTLQGGDVLQSPTTAALREGALSPRQDSICSGMDQSDLLQNKAVHVIWQYWPFRIQYYTLHDQSDHIIRRISARECEAWRVTWSQPSIKCSINMSLLALSGLR